MARHASQVRVRRVVVGLDSRHPPALDEAAELAETLEAELVGLFVEDPQLLAFARLPFAREVGLASAARRQLDRSTMERSLRALAAVMERACAAATEGTSVRWSFRSARGPLAGELLAAADRAQPTLILPPRVTANPVAVGVLEDGSDSQRALLELLHDAFGAAPSIVRRALDEALLAQLIDAGHPVLVLG